MDSMSAETEVSLALVVFLFACIFYSFKMLFSHNLVTVHIDLSVRG